MVFNQQILPSFSHWPCYCTVHVFVVIQFCDIMWPFVILCGLLWYYVVFCELKWICAGFLSFVYIYMYVLQLDIYYQEGRVGILYIYVLQLDIYYQEGRVGILLTGLREESWNPINWSNWSKRGGLESY